LARFHQYKDKCNNCRKLGHKASKCHSRTNKNEKSSNENKPKQYTGDIKCFKCGKMGHFQSKCPGNKEDRPKKKQSEKGVDIVLMTTSRLTKVKNVMWIADSGASTHITTTTDVGLFDTRNVNAPVQIGNGKLVYATKNRKLTIKYQNKKGKEALLLLKNIQYIPGFFSTFSA